MTLYIQFQRMQAKQQINTQGRGLNTMKQQGDREKDSELGKIQMNGITVSTENDFLILTK